MIDWMEDYCEDFLAMCIRALSIVSMFMWDNALNNSIMGGIPDDADT